MRADETEMMDALRRLFPACVTEAQGQDGQLRPAIDVDALRQELSDRLIEGQAERYQLTWPGKRQAILAANQPCAKTLRPCCQASVNFETTKNLFIEGFKNTDIHIDNREVSTNIQKVQERQNRPILSYIKPSGEYKYNLDSKFRLNDGNCENDSGDKLHSSFRRMAGKKITTTRN